MEDDERHEHECFETFPTDFAEAWLYSTIIPYGAAVGWGGGYILGAAVSLLRWVIYPRIIWSHPIFCLMRGVGLWIASLYVAWMLWRMGARAQAGLIVLNRVFLVGILGGGFYFAMSGPIADFFKAGHPRRLFARRFLGVTDIEGDIVKVSQGRSFRVLIGNLFFVVIAAAWTAFTYWLGTGAA